MTEADEEFGAQTRRLLDAHGPRLLTLAAASIRHGLVRRAPLPVDPAAQPADLRAPGACFVTLNREGRLRGCIGSPQAHRPLALDVAENAYSAAFRDPRFPPLTEAELDGLKLSISVLSPQSPIEFSDEAGLLAALRPHADGLVIADGPHRALFLPSVWEQLPDPHRFLEHLKLKAGMPADHFSPTFKAWRFVALELKPADPQTLWSPQP
jgi:AmmeMemoRadiSam system protein A